MSLGFFYAQYLHSNAIVFANFYNKLAQRWGKKR